MSSRLAYILLIPLVHGCGDSPKPDDIMTPGWLSGTRLRARLEVAGSARRFVTFSDTMLDFDCVFDVASDGKRRCIQPITYNDNRYFSDANCQTPVVSFEAGTPVKGYLQKGDQPLVCGTGETLYAIGATLNPAMIYQEGPSTPCSPYGAPNPGATVVGFGAPVDPTVFVAATEVLEPRGDRLRARVMVADDGARQVLELFDSQRNQRCSSDQEFDTVGYACVPSERSYDYQFFADAACTQHASSYTGYTQSRCNRPPGIILRLNPRPVRYFEVGAQLTQAYEPSPTCVPSLSPAWVHDSYYALGAEIARASFAPLTVANEGSDRVRVITTRTASGELGEQLGFYDSTRKIQCRADSALDGKLRCVPQTGLNINEFSDAQCKMPLFAAQAGVKLPAAGDYIESINSLFQIGAKIATPTDTYQLGGTVCQLRTPDAGADYYALTPVPASESPEMMRTLE